MKKQVLLTITVWLCTLASILAAGPDELREVLRQKYTLPDLGRGLPAFAKPDGQEMSVPRPYGSGTIRGRATLTGPTEPVAFGDTFAVECRFDNDKNHGYRYYDLFLAVQAGPKPARWILYDSKKRPIEDMGRIMIYSGPGWTGDQSCWTYLPAGRAVVISKTFIAGQGTNPILKHLIEPGDFYLQVVFIRTFVSEMPPQGSKKTFTREDCEELFRSNAIKLTFTQKRESEQAESTVPSKAAPNASLDVR